MKLIPHTDSQTRNNRIQEHTMFSTFLQSRERGDVNKRLGHEVMRYDIVDGNKDSKV